MFVVELFCGLRRSKAVRALKADNAICRKCGGQVEFARTQSGLCCVVRCTSCGLKTESYCSTDEAEMEWAKINEKAAKAV